MVTRDKRQLTQVAVPGGALAEEHVSEILDATSSLIHDRWLRERFHDNRWLREVLTTQAWTFNAELRRHLDAKPEWVVQRGKPCGTLPKRLAKLAAASVWSVRAAPGDDLYDEERVTQRLIHKPLKAAHPDLYAMLVKSYAELGASLGPRVNCATEYAFERRSTMDWESGDFGDDGSCFWTCRTGVRELLAESGRFAALCFYELDQRYDHYDEQTQMWIRSTTNNASAWTSSGRVLTIKLKWQRDAAGPAFALWNAYGIDLPVAARALATGLGFDYRPARLTNQGSCTQLVYINGPSDRNNGFLVAPFGHPLFEAQRLDLDLDANGDEWCEECGFAHCRCEDGGSRRCGNCGELSEDCSCQEDEEPDRYGDVSPDLVFEPLPGREWDARGYAPNAGCNCTDCRAQRVGTRNTNGLVYARMRTARAARAARIQFGDLIEG